MKALVKTGPGPGELALTDVPEPHAGPGQLVMRVMAGAICGTDVHIARGTLPVTTPRILGHELAGAVAEVGPGVTAFALGQLVTTETDASFCGRCRFCLAGDMHLCAGRTGIGTSAEGGFAEYVALPAGGVHPLPAGVGVEAGALAEPLAVAVRAVVERGDVRERERVGVVGPGTVGLLAAQVVAARGADVVVAGLVRHAARFQLAAELGLASAIAIDDPDAPARWDAARGALDVVIECSGSADGIRAGIGLLRKGGRLVLVGFQGHPVEVDIDLVINRELSLVASRGKRPTSFSLALELMAEGRVRTAPLITHQFALAAWQAAFATADLPGTKVLLRM